MEYEREIGQLEEQYYTSKIASIGSNRTYEQSKEIIESNPNLTGYSIEGNALTYEKDSVNEKGEVTTESKTFAWQDHFDYKKDENMP
jgi:hypothetical protein